MVRLTPRQKVVLTALGRLPGGAGGPKALAEALGLKSKGSSAEVLARLALRGWVARVGRGRSRGYALTDRARRAIDGS